MNHPNRYDLEDEIQRLKTTTQTHELRQEIPFNLIEEWADKADRSMDEIYNTGEDR
jgi:hypothetical protein